MNQRFTSQFRRPLSPLYHQPVAELQAEMSRRVGTHVGNGVVFQPIIQTKTVLLGCREPGLTVDSRPGELVFQDATGLAQLIEDSLPEESKRGLIAEVSKISIYRAKHGGHNLALELKAPELTTESRLLSEALSDRTGKAIKPFQHHRIVLAHIGNIASAVTLADSVFDYPDEIQLEPLELETMTSAQWPSLPQTA